MSWKSILKQVGQPRWMIETGAPGTMKTRLHRMMQENENYNDKFPTFDEYLDRQYQGTLEEIKTRLKNNFKEGTFERMEQYYKDLEHAWRNSL
tara:strand:- start:13081 stop:13359 length:279 start_codon:yes stop_codon:yes gene_type:complete